MIHSRPVRLEVEGAVLDAVFCAPVEPQGIVIIALGGEGNRDRAAAEAFHRSRLATLLVNLIGDPPAVPDVRRLARCVAGAVDWARAYPQTCTLPVGLMGASAGAPAALVAAEQRAPAVRAVVSRGPRPDLAEDALDRLAAPTLLIADGLDPQGVELNRQSFERLRGPKELRIIPGAAQSLDAPATLSQAARHARDWFVDHLV